jgi:prepilin-type N-terminal cleavage/methylation domain-containing protein
MAHRMTRKQGNRKGFSLIEVLIGVFLVAVAVLGLVQLYTMAIMNNVRAGEIANATFLAQQEIDYLRTLTRDELSTFPDSGRGESDDDLIDVNADGTTDYRRLTNVTFQDTAFQVRVLVFPPAQALVSRSTLVADPDRYKVRASLNTVISR